MTVLPKPTSASLSGSPQGILERVHDWVTTVDHKKLGLLYIFSGLFRFGWHAVHGCVAIKYEALPPLDA